MNEAITLLMLLLGSYDPETREVLYRIKDEIAKLSTLYKDFNLIPLLLSDVEVYELIDSEYGLVIIEKFKSKYTVMLFSNRGELIDVEDVAFDNIRDVECYIKRELSIEGLRRLDILEKFRFLICRSYHVFLVRHVELTRCGEYIELAYLILQGLKPFKITLLIRDRIPISTMLKELIRAFRIYHEEYKDLDELLYIIRSIVNHLIEELKGYR